MMINREPQHATVDKACVTVVTQSHLCFWNIRRRVNLENPLAGFEVAVMRLPV